MMSLSGAVWRGIPSRHCFIKTNQGSYIWLNIWIAQRTGLLAQSRSDNSVEKSSWEDYAKLKWVPYNRIRQNTAVFWRSATAHSVPSTVPYDKAFNHRRDGYGYRIYGHRTTVNTVTVYSPSAAPEFPVVAKSSDDADFCDHKCSERRWAAVASYALHSDKFKVRVIGEVIFNKHFVLPADHGNLT